jgi:hypothetical protein
MGDFYVANDAIVARLKGAWSATPLERLRFDNEPLFDSAALIAPWGCVHVMGGPETAYPGGEGRVRIEGTVTLQLFVPKGSGTTDLAAMYRDARAILAHKRFDGVAMGGLSSHSSRPASEDGHYYGVEATASFFYIS